MRKYILKDKLSYPVTITFLLGIFQFTNYKNDWKLFLVSLLIIALILSCLTVARHLK